LTQAKQSYPTRRISIGTDSLGSATPGGLPPGIGGIVTFITPLPSGAIVFGPNDDDPCFPVRFLPMADSIKIDLGDGAIASDDGDLHNFSNAISEIAGKFFPVSAVHETFILSSQG
jgi:hypothetical protein